MGSLDLVHLSRFHLFDRARRLPFADRFRLEDRESSQVRRDRDRGRNPGVLFHEELHPILQFPRFEPGLH